MVFDLVKVKEQLKNARATSSERQLLQLLKENSFLFSELRGGSGNLNNTYK